MQVFFFFSTQKLNMSQERTVAKARKDGQVTKDL